MTEYKRTGISRVAVTGGTGFVGRRLVERLLAEGYAVRMLSRRDPEVVSEALEVFSGDLLDADTDLGMFLDGVDVIFHCAGEVRDKTRMQALNVDATSRLLDAARGRQLHWVQLSSVGVYGARGSGVITEDTPVAPKNTYEKTKAAADELLLAISADEPMTWSILRPANIFGEGMLADGLGRISDVVKGGCFGQIGKGKHTVHYIYVDNIIDALLLCMQDKRAVGRVFNISDTNYMVDCIRIIAEFYGKNLSALSIPEWLFRALVTPFVILPGFPLSMRTIDILLSNINYSRSRIENELGYDLRISLQEGMRRYLICREDGKI